MAVRRGLGPVVENDTLGLYVLSESADGECKVFTVDEWRPQPDEDTVLIRGFSRMCRWVNKRVRLCPPITIDERRIDQLLASVQRHIARAEEDAKSEEIEELIKELA